MLIPLVTIISGSLSDNEIVQKVTKKLDELHIGYSAFVASAHREPERLDKILAETSNCKVYICIAGLSAALPGVVASKVSQPVIGVPVASALGGLDALLSIAQMPSGVPVATVGINNGTNAAVLAARILGVNPGKPKTYAEAGVDRNKEEATVHRILDLIKKTHQDMELLPHGHYAGAIKVGDQIVCLTTDGVGSKVLLAQELGDLKTVGIDCVAMNVNDLIATGCLPLAFVDYIAVERPEIEQIESLVEGLVKGCLDAGIPLIGGETAVMPEVIKGINFGFDIAGTAVGVTDQLISGEDIGEGDVIIGISSSGIHSNGLTLARKLLSDKKWKSTLLTPTRIYVSAIKELLECDITIHGMAHITGGGFTNLLRLGQHHFCLDQWEVPELFLEIQRQGSISEEEMYRTFNMGIGYVVIVPSEDEENVINILEKYFPAFKIGVIKGGNKITVGDFIVGEGS